MNSAGTILTLNFDDGQLVIEALAECPFKTVFELIGRLNRQANAGGNQLDRQYALSRADLALVVGALAKLPYQRVHLLIKKIEQQVEQGAVAPRSSKRKDT